MIYEPSAIFADVALNEELQRISLAIEGVSNLPFLPVLAREPLKPRDGQTAICDGVNWDPLGDGLKRPVWYDFDDEEWKAFT